MTSIPPEDTADVHAPAPKEGEEAALAVLNGDEPPAGFGTRSGFELLQRQALLMSKSELVPKPYNGNVANCSIALELALRIGCSPIMVCQNLDVIQGRPAWRGQYIIAAVNQHPRFASSLAFIYSGEPNTDSWSCYAQALRKDGVLVKGPTVSIKMAKDEGWYAKPGSKWKTLPELMLSYRAASFFGKLNVPEVLMGMPSIDEARDMGEQMRTVNKLEIVGRFSPPSVCTHEAGPVEKQTPSPYPEEPPYIEEVCSGCSRSWAEIEKERESTT